MSKKEKVFYISSFLFYLFILSLSPISGDDWGNYIAGSNGLYHCIGNAVGMYFSWEGRFVSRVLINILTYHKILWNIVNAFLIVLFNYLCIKIIKPKNNKLSYLFVFLIIPFMNLYTFSQTITWVAGNITYFFEIPLILIYYMMLSKKKYDFKFNFIFLLLLSASIPMFAEHMAAILVIGNLIILFYNYYKTKKIDKKIIIFTIVAIVFTLLMYLSPGTKLRSASENLDFNKLSILGKIIYNIPAFVYYTFMDNYYLLVLFIITNFVIIKKRFKKKWIKILLTLFLTVVPLITLIIYPLSVVKNINIINNIWLIIYYIVFLIISFFLNIFEKNKESTFLFIIGIMANCVMLMSPTWGYRTTLFTYMMLALANIILITKYLKNNKFIEYILKLFSIIICIMFIVLYINIFRCQKDLEKGIKKQLKENKDVIDVVMFPNYVNCNINPDNDFHLVKYKEYYSIPQDKQINFIDGKWHYFVIYKK